MCRKGRIQAIATKNLEVALSEGGRREVLGSFKLKVTAAWQYQTLMWQFGTKTPDYPHNPQDENFNRALSCRRTARSSSIALPVRRLHFHSERIQPRLYQVIT